MISKEIYLNLLESKKYDDIILQFEEDFIHLFKIMLDKKNIIYENNNIFLYYSSCIKINYPEVSQNIVFLESRLCDIYIDSVEKINILIDMYKFLLKKYEKK